MRKSTCIAAGLVVALCLALLWWAPWTHSPGDASIADGTRDRLLLESGESPGASETPVLLGGRTGNETDLDESMLAGAGGVANERKSEDRVAIVGRVVDERRRPASGVAVGVLIAGEREVLGQTDERGRFALRVPRPRSAGFERLTVVARRAPSDFASQIHYFSREGPVPTDVGVLVLAHSTPLEVEVLVDGAPRADADVWISSWEQAAPGHLCAHARTNATGRAKLYVGSAGAHRVVAFAHGRSRAVVMTSLPRTEPGPLRIALPPARSVDLTLVFQDDGFPVAHATVELLDTVRGVGWMTSPVAFLPALPTTTDEAGRTRIEGLAREDTPWLRVGGPGLPVGTSTRPLVRRDAHIPAEVVVATVELPRARTVRWPVTTENGPIPVDGTVVQLSSDPHAVAAEGPPTARMEGGRLVAHGVGPRHLHALATTSDGRIAKLFVAAGEAEGVPTSFRSERTIDVLVKYTDGAPASGLSVVARPEGGHAGAPLLLDTAGRATIERLLEGRVHVYVEPVDAMTGGMRIGTVDLDGGSGSVEAIVQRARRGLLRIRMDGEPRIPATYFLQVGPMRVADVEEDVEKGEIGFAWRPAAAGDAGSVGVLAPGWLLAGEEPIAGGAAPPARLVGDGDQPDVADIEFVSGGVLVARVSPPEDLRLSLRLQRRNAADTAWKDLSTASQPVSAGSGTVEDRQFSPLPAGHYRVIDAETGIASEGVDVEPGQPAAEVALDLSHAALASGRVELPPGYAYEGATVRIEGIAEGRLNAATSERGAAVSSRDGSFRVRIPGNMDVTIVPLHPTLSPAETGGQAVVREARDNIVLRLEERALAKLLLDPKPDFKQRVRGSRRCRVQLFHGAPDGQPAYDLDGRIEGNLLTFAGYAPGEYTIWLDVPLHAPLLLGQRALGSAGTDLGRASLNKGASVLTRIVVPEGQAAPHTTIYATFQGSPFHTRLAESEGKAAFTLEGLAPGTYVLNTTLYPARSGPPPAAVVLEIRGDEAIERTLDLR